MQTWTRHGSWHHNLLHTINGAVIKHACFSRLAHSSSRRSSRYTHKGFATINPLLTHLVVTFLKCSLQNRLYKYCRRRLVWCRLARRSVSTNRFLLLLSRPKLLFMRLNLISVSTLLVSTNVGKYEATFGSLAVPLRWMERIGTKILQTPASTVPVSTNVG